MQFFARKQSLLDNHCFKCGKYGHKALACRYDRIKMSKRGSPPLKTKMEWRRKDELQKTSSSNDIKEECFVLQMDIILRESRSLPCAK